MTRPARKRRFRPRKTPLQGRARRTIDAILIATARILVQDGYAALTTNRVAAKAGVSIGTLYEWFPGKEALVAALVDRHLGAAEALLAERAAGLAGAELDRLALGRALATVMVELHEDDPRLHRALTEEVPQPAETRARVRAIEERMAAALAARIAGMHRQPDVAARMIVALLESATHRWATDREGTPLPREVLIEELARMIAGYLSEPEPERPRAVSARGR